MRPEEIVIWADLKVPPEHELSLRAEVQAQHDTALLVVSPSVADDSLLAVKVQTWELLLEAFVYVIAMEFAVKLRQKDVYALSL
jgi:hypothetical protein